MGLPLPGSGQGRDGHGPEGRDLFTRLLAVALLGGKRVVAFFYQGLQAFGAVWVPTLPPDPCCDASLTMLDSPPEGHPERLCRQTPLSPAEIEIWADFYADP